MTEVRAGARVRVVLVHGSRLSSAQWLLHRAFLQDAFDVRTPDLPGHGRRMGESFTMPAALAVLAEAVGDDAVPTVLVGHSLGGYVAMEYAAQHPGRLSGLITIGAAAVPSGIGAAAYRGLARFTEQLGDQRVAAFNDRALERMVDPRIVAALQDQGYGFAAVGPSWNAVMAGGRPDLLRGLEIPVLIVRGEFDQLGADAGQYLKAARHGELVTVRGASHLLPLTRPWQSAGIIARFAQRVADSGSPGHRSAGSPVREVTGP